MSHLKVDEIIDFVSLSELNHEAVALSAAVNGHIRKCQKCLRLTKAVQMIHDEFAILDTDADFKTYINAELNCEKEENEQILELRASLELDEG